MSAGTNISAPPALGICLEEYEYPYPVRFARMRVSLTGETEAIDWYQPRLAFEADVAVALTA